MACITVLFSAVPVNDSFVYRSRQVTPYRIRYESGFELGVDTDIFQPEESRFGMFIAEAWILHYVDGDKFQAFYEINLINVTAAATAYLFYQINPHAGLLFAPYLLWLTYATALSFKIFKDNPEASVKITEIKSD